MGGLMVEGNVPLVLMAGKVLSGVAVLLLLLAFWNVWRRESLPDVAYGGISLSTKRLRWIWVLVLAGGFALGVNEDPTVRSTRSMEDPEALASASDIRTVSINFPLPFYRFERERIFGAGELLSEQVLEGFVIPGPLISALLAYLILVVRWDSSNRFARRILQGRKWRKEMQGVEPSGEENLQGVKSDHG